MRDLRVNVAGLDFFGDAGPFLIGPEGFSGWDDGVEMRVDQQARPQAHGSIPLPGFQDSRVVQLSGNVLADSPAQLGYLKDRFLGLLNSGQTGRIQVSRPWGTRWADCQLTGQSRFTERGGRDSATFQLQVWCADPVKYGDTNTFAVPSGNSYVQLFHRGNTLSLPTLVIAGSMPGGYKIQSSSGAEYSVTRALVSGTPHTIDMRDGMLQIGSAYASVGVGVAGIWRISPGNNQSIRVIPISTGTATMTAYVTDSFI